MVDAPTGAKDEIARIWRAYLSLSVILTARICKPAVARFVHSMGGIGTSMWVLFASFTFLLKRSQSQSQAFLYGRDALAFAHILVQIPPME